MCNELNQVPKTDVNEQSAENVSMRQILGAILADAQENRFLGLDYIATSRENEEDNA